MSIDFTTDFWQRIRIDTLTKALDLISVYVRLKFSTVVDEDETTLDRIDARIRQRIKEVIDDEWESMNSLNRTK